MEILLLYFNRILSCQRLEICFIIKGLKSVYGIKQLDTVKIACLPEATRLL